MAKDTPTPTAASTAVTLETLADAGDNAARVALGRDDAVKPLESKAGRNAGNTASETVYADLEGKIVKGSPGEGFRGEVVVAEGDIITEAVAARLKA